jgi:hypothetical protein
MYLEYQIANRHIWWTHWKIGFWELDAQVELILSIE